MARATSIWICCLDNYISVASFTVKHECKTWLEKNNYKYGENPIVWVFKIPDGGPQDHWTGTEWVKITAIPIWEVKQFLDET